MSDVRKLILGIVAVLIGLFSVLSTGNGLIPIVGGLIGLYGAYVVIRVLLRGNLR